MRVFIPTAGTGSRLGLLTKNLNKSLITIGNKPVISHIIDVYPPSTEFVIALGFDGKKVKDYLNICYPKKKFHFIKINNFNGTGSGLRHTLINCEKKLQVPFIFHACDSILYGVIPKLNKNWIGTSRIVKNNLYRSIEVKNKKIIFHEKNIKKKYNLLTYIGVCGINDYKIFWENLKKEKKNIGEISGLKGLVENQRDILIKKFYWYDTGNILSLSKIRKINKIKSVNVLEKESEAIWFVDNKVIKYHQEKNFIKNRVIRQKILRKYTPKIINWKDNFYLYKKKKGQILSKKINKKIFNNLLEYLTNFWFENKINISRERLLKDSLSFYKSKTYIRADLFLKKNQNIDNIKYINNIEISGIKKLLEKINWNYICNGIPCNFHGDLHFENILYTNNKKFILLDWRQDFNNSLDYGDLYYDLAKIMHGLIISHQKVLNEQYSIKVLNNNSVKINFSISKKYKELLIIYVNWIKKNNYDLEKINILTALIFLNIAPLHTKNYSIYLFHLSKLLLSNKNYLFNYLKL